MWKQRAIVYSFFLNISIKSNTFQKDLIYPCFILRIILPLREFLAKVKKPVSKGDASDSLGLCQVIRFSYSVFS